MHEEKTEGDCSGTFLKSSIQSHSLRHTVSLLFHHAVDTLERSRKSALTTRLTSNECVWCKNIRWGFNGSTGIQYGCGNKLFSFKSTQMLVLSAMTNCSYWLHVDTSILRWLTCKLVRSLGVTGHATAYCLTNWSLLFFLSKRMGMDSQTFRVTGKGRKAGLKMGSLELSNPFCSTGK